MDLVSAALSYQDPILPDMLKNLEEYSANTTNQTDINENGSYGFLVAAKGGAQFLFNPFIGLMVTRYGYRRPMFVGDAILLVSAVALGYGKTFIQLVIIRIFQGLSSSVTAVTGMGLLAATFTDDKKRGRVMGIAICGLSLGITVGPVYGSLLYQFVGPQMPFLVLGVMIGLALVLQSMQLQADNQGTKDHSMKSIFYLIADPYVLIVAGNIFLLNLDVSVILAFVPIRLIELQHPDTWELGIVVLPSSIGYLISSFIFPRCSHCLPRWLCGMLGLILSSGSLVGLAFCYTFGTMLVANTFLGIALGMVSVSMQPIFAKIVDLRHSSVYGNVYAISDMSVCLALCIGPLVGGPVMYALGFQWMVLGIAVLNLAYSVCSLLLRNIDNMQYPCIKSSPVSKLDNFPAEANETDFLIPGRKRSVSVCSVRSMRNINS